MFPTSIGEFANIRAPFLKNSDFGPLCWKQRESRILYSPLAGCQGVKSWWAGQQLSCALFLGSLERALNERTPFHCKFSRWQTAVQPSKEFSAARHFRSHTGNTPPSPRLSDFQLPTDRVSVAQIPIYAHVKQTLDPLLGKRDGLEIN